MKIRKIREKINLILSVSIFRRSPPFYSLYNYIEITEIPQDTFTKLGRCLMNSNTPTLNMDKYYISMFFNFKMVAIKISIVKFHEQNLQNKDVDFGICQIRPTLFYLNPNTNNNVCIKQYKFE